MTVNGLTFIKGHQQVIVIQHILTKLGTFMDIYVSWYLDNVSYSLWGLHHRRVTNIFDFKGNISTSGRQQLSR